MIGAGVLASAAVVAFTDQLDKKYIKILGFIAAVCTALIAAFNPLSLGLGFRDAWRVLDSAVLRHNSMPDKYPLETVLDAVDKGEAILTKTGKALVPNAETSASAPKK